MKDKDKSKQELLDEVHRLRNKVQELEHSPKKSEFEQNQRIQNAQKYKTLVESSLVGIAISDLNDNLIFANRKFADMFGYRKFEMENMTLLDLSPHSEQDKLQKMSSRRKQGKTDVYETQFLAKNGKPVDVLINASPYRNPKGDIVATIGIVLDITERKQAQKKLRESEKQYRQIFENSPVGIFLITSRGQLQHANPEMTRIIGASSPQEAANIDREKIINFFEEKSRKDEFINQLNKNGSLKNFEFKARRLDGKHIWLNVNARVRQRFPDGSFLIDGFAQDITERKQAQQELANEHRLLRTFIENIPDSVYVKDKKARVTLANPADIDYRGADCEDDVVGKTDFDFFPEETAQKYFADDKKVLEEGKCIINREEVLILPNGEKRWLLTNKLPLKDEEGNINGLIGMGRDITKRKQAEEVLKKSEKKYRAIVETVQDALLICRNDKILFFNDSFIDLTGYDQNKLFSMGSSQLFLEGNHVCCLNQKNPDREEALREEGRLRKANGDQINVDIEATLIEFQGQKARLLSLRDITEQKKLIEKLQKSGDKIDSFGDFIPVCSWCKKIRDDDKPSSPWIEPDRYIAERLPEIKFSHGICPDCVDEFYPHLKSGQNKDKDSQNK